MEFYKILSKIMKERNMKIPDVVKISGVPDSTIRSIIDRKSKSVALEVAFKLSKGLGVSLEYLNYGEEDHSTHTIYNKEHSELINAYDHADYSTKNAARRVLGLNDINTNPNKPDPDEIARLLKEKENTALIAAYGHGPIKQTYTDEEIETINRLLEEKRKKGEIY